MNCLSAAVDPELLLSKEDISILDTDLAFHSTIQPNGFVYKNSAGDEAVITFNQDTDNMFGSFKTHQDKSYAIEKCHHGYVWKEFNVTSFGEDVVQKISVPDIPRMKKLVEAGAADTTTQVTYSVMFYVSIFPIQGRLYYIRLGKSMVESPTISGSEFKGSKKGLKI